MNQVLLNICLTAIGLCLFKMLIPENHMKKQTNFLVACFFLASLLFFFTSGGINLAGALDFSSSETSYINFEEHYMNAQKRAVENEIGKEMKTRIEPILAEEGIYPQEIYTIVNISDTYSISINEIRLVFPEMTEESLEVMKKAIDITQEEVGDRILVSGDFKR
ncbi:MAG: hypothetical protein FWD34_05195 [Oscillospiraceae bacterium]|nr:hypothetical protein [Oscillospiraceae bacterium]